MSVNEEIKEEMDIFEKTTEAKRHLRKYAPHLTVLSLGDEVNEILDEAANAQGKTREEVLEEMINVYIT